jgi:phage-related protein (TIGR01555 family)
MGKDSIALLKEKVTDLETRNDSLQNLMHGAGTKYDSKRYYKYKKDNSILLSDIQATDMYNSNWIASSIAKLPPHDMTNKGFYVENDTEELIIKDLNKKKFNKSLYEAVLWSRVYGGAIIVMGINDGGNLQDEVKYNNIKEIEFFRVYDKTRITVQDIDLQKDPSKKNYGMPEYYEINTLDGKLPKIHASRVLRFDGELLPEDSFVENNRWHASIYCTMLERLIGMDMTYGNVESIVERYIQDVLKMDSIESKMQAGSITKLMERLNQIDLTKHIINTLAIDKDQEEIIRLTATVAGLNDVIATMENAVCAAACIPRVRLFGTSSKGLSASGADDIQLRIYYDTISSMQMQDLLGPVSRVVWLEQIASNGPTKGQQIENWSIKFNKLWQLTQKEELENQKLQSEIDEKYWNIGAKTSDEITIDRFSAGEFSYGNTISESHQKEIEERETIGNQMIDEGADNESETD